MNDSAIITFLPWLRRGVSASIDQKDDSSVGGPRAGFGVELEFNKDSNSPLKESVIISLYGPGEVLSLDSQTIIKTWPKPNVDNFEANLFPMIEFDQSDLPWRYTPARASRQDRLKPWLCLIVLKEDEIEQLDPAGSDRLLPAVTVKGSESLPDLDQSGAWAHIHVSGHKVSKNDVADDEEIAKLLATQSHCLASRLLCPRRLDNLTGYTAFLVPTLERGRLSGLGLTVDDEIDALEKAWKVNDRLIQLPVYYMWSFRTGPLGDFEYLATILEPHKLGAEVGFRKIDVKKPGLGLPDASANPMNLDGALVSTVAPNPTWSDGGEFISNLVNILNLRAKYLKEKELEEKSLLVPPLYGKLYADRDQLPIPKPGDPINPTTSERLWFWEINIDPRRRATSGLGTQVIQSNQEQLMASAWEQADAIRKANREIRFAQLSIEISARSYAKNIKPQETEAAVYLTAPLHSRIRTDTTTPGLLSAFSARCPNATVGAMLRKSAISKGALEPQWRRRSSPLGAIGRRQGRPNLEGKPEFLKNLASGDLSASSIPSMPTSTISFSNVKPYVIDSPRREFHHEEGESSRSPSSTARSFASAIDAVLNAFETEPEEAEELIGFKPEEFDDLKEMIVADLEPRKNIASSIKKRLTLTDDLLPQPVITGPRIYSPKATEGGKDLYPIMRAPEFPQPMYAYLRDLSQDWLLPGVDKVPENSVSLLKANQRFIEAFMVGLNHEMSRELLWRGYPTDQKGTYFRQFWNSVGVISDIPIPAEKLKDIKPINEWANNNLGQNTSRELSNGNDRLVLLIRGELLKRYPNTIIYAAKAVKNGDSLKISSEEKHPIFSGTLMPDISFFGFDLTKKKAQEGDGWFFILQEQPSEPRFGLDVANEAGQALTNWAALSWGHLVESLEDLTSIVYIDLNFPRPKTDFNNITDPEAKPEDANYKWTNGGSSDIAYITYQPPVRVAIHANKMLPEDAT